MKQSGGKIKDDHYAIHIRPLIYKEHVVFVRAMYVILIMAWSSLFSAHARSIAYIHYSDITSCGL